MPMRQPSGRPRRSRDRSITSRRRALPSLPRCERPSNASASTFGDQPGRLVHGPEEKFGLAGRKSGFGGVVIALSPILTDGSRPVGGSWPAALIDVALQQVKRGRGQPSRESYSHKLVAFPYSTNQTVSRVRHPIYRQVRTSQRI